MGDSDESLQISHAFDLNVPIVVKQEGFLDSLPTTRGEGASLGEGLLSQDSDPFNLVPIIKAITKGGTKRGCEEKAESIESYEEGLHCVKKNTRSGIDQAEATYERSP